MNKVPVFIIYLLIVFTPTIIFAQSPTITKSEVIETIGGKKFYIHTVKPKETAYSITKFYGISFDELVLHNPDVVNGLAIGILLKIPTIETQTATTAPTEKKEVIKNNNQNYFIHTVKPKETAYSITKFYGISFDELVLHNPDAVNGLAIGALLKIPTIEKQTATTAPAEKEVFRVNNQNYFIHKVEQGQTLYSISRIHSISIDAIKEANPAYKDNLPVGVNLLIPLQKNNTQTNASTKPASTSAQAPTELANTTANKPKPLQEQKTDSIQQKSSSTFQFLKKDKAKNDSLLTKNDSLKSGSDSDLFSFRQKRKDVRIALMLPFMLDINSQKIAQSTKDEQKINIHPSSFAFIEYYEGILLAIDSLRKKGIEVHVEVYDSNKDSAGIAEILSTLKSSKVDIIIGPVFPVAFAQVAEFAKLHAIPVVSPLSNDDYVFADNPYVIQLNSPQRYRYKEIEKFTHNFAQSNVIFVYNSIDYEKKHIDECIGILNYTDSTFYSEKDMQMPRNAHIQISEVYFPKSGIEGVEKALDNTKTNIIIVLSRNQAFINNLVTKLYQFSAQFDLHLIGLPMWEKYDNLELDFLCALQFRFYTNGYVMYDTQDTKNFLKLYREIYKTEPTKFSFQGYDHMLYFSEIILSGRNILNKTLSTTKNGLHDSYKFYKKDENSGLINTTVKTVYYTKEFEKHLE